MNDKKKKYQIIFFVAIMLMTFYVIFRKQNLSELLNSINSMALESIIIAMILGILYVCFEGIIIWYLLSAMGNKSNVWHCIQYSFIGFFYSGITPSATGGQPMQLYYMNSDGNKVSDSSVILMIVAITYKLVLVFIGLSLLISWYQPLKSFMKQYIMFFFAGIVLNMLVILALVCTMIFPNILLKMSFFFEKMLICLGIWRETNVRKEKVQYFISNYRHTVEFIVNHKSKLAVVFMLTLIQRISMLLITYIVYCGCHLSESNIFKILALQAAIYIAVEMLPVPGAQGITELVYQNVFSNIFPQVYLVSSMLVIRGINFYFLLIISSILAVRRVLKKNTR